MNIEQLSTMTESDLHARANAHLELLDRENLSEMTRQHHVSQAQFYLAELDRRKQTQERTESGRIAQRDYSLEKWVIGLIGAELVLAVVAIVFGWVEGNKQMDVLDKLNKSSAETAATLTAVRQAQEASLDTQRYTLDNIVAMNNALQDEMDLNFAEALQYSGGMTGGGHERVDFANNGRTTLFFWGSRFDGQSSKMQQKATALTPGKSVSFDVSDLIKHLKQTSRSPFEMSIPFELYFKRENG